MRTIGAVFIYRCPTMGLNVQGWLTDAPSSENSSRTTYETVICMAYTKVHLVNPKTGKTIWDGRG
jgi:hypothetical protein